MRQWVAVASAGPYASLHLAPDRQLHQHPTTLVFYRPDSLPAAQPTTSKHWRQHLPSVLQKLSDEVLIWLSVWSCLKTLHLAQLYLDGQPSTGRYAILVCNRPTRSTQPCISPGSLNQVPALAGVKAGMSPLQGGRYMLCDHIRHVSCHGSEAGCKLLYSMVTGLSSRVVSASDCGVRGSRFESRRWQLCLSRQLLWYIQSWARAVHLYCSA